MLDRARIRLALSALTLLLTLPNCHHAGSGSDAGNGGGDDANVPQTDTGRHHFDPCTSPADCPPSDTCDFPDSDPPSGDTTAPRQCRPPCAMDSDCVEPLAGITLAVACGPDHYCVGYCSPGMPVLPMCELPAQCHQFPGMPQGYCYLPAP